MTPRLLVASLLAAFVALPAIAQPATPRIDQRQANQERRLQKGVQSGQLNAAEAARLEKGQANVQRLENRAEADGMVTKAEKARIHRAQDRQSTRIAKQKHDKQKAKTAGAGG